jgi:hypothetical protein
MKLHTHLPHVAVSEWLLILILTTLLFLAFGIVIAPPVALPL